MSDTSAGSAHPIGLILSDLHFLIALFITSIARVVDSESRGRCRRALANFWSAQCEGTMPLDIEAIGRGCGTEITAARQLCRRKMSASRPQPRGRGRYGRLYAAGTSFDS